MSTDSTRIGSHEPTVDWHVDDTPPEPYELPEIVPATDDGSVPQDEAPAALAPASLPPFEGTVAPEASADPIEQRTGVQGLGEYVGPVPTEAASIALRRPGRRPRVRRVTRVLRHVDPWSAFKVGIIFSAVAYIVVLTSGVLLWRVAAATGTLDNVERWFTQFGWETFEFDGEAIFRNARTIGLFGVVATTGGIVLLVTLFNLVSDIMGGVRMTVLEEEVVERTATSSRRYVVRRTPSASARVTGAGDPAWTVDDGPDPLALVAERPPVPASADWSIAASDESEVTAEATRAATADATTPVASDDLPDPATDLLAEPVQADWSIDEDAEERAADAAVEPREDLADERVDDPAGGRLPDVVGEQVPDVADERVPDVAGAAVLGVTGGRAPDVVDERIPDVADERVPDVVDEPVPEVVDEPVPEVVDEPVREVVDEPVPEVVDEPVREVADEPVREAVDERVPDVVGEPILHASTGHGAAGERTTAAADTSGSRAPVGADGDAASSTRREEVVEDDRTEPIPGEVLATGGTVRPRKGDGEGSRRRRDHVDVSPG